jgi:hypothetical protein
MGSSPRAKYLAQYLALSEGGSSLRALPSALGEGLYPHSGWAPPSPRAVDFALGEEFFSFFSFFSFFQQPQIFTQITYIIAGVDAKCALSANHTASRKA